MLTDPYGRPLKHLRLSVTKKCNYNCIYCHREGEEESTSREMSLEEIVELGKAAKRIGISKVKLTGGEPLIRDDIVEIIKELASLKFEEVSMTTNGFYLKEFASELVGAGLKRVNVNFPSLDRETYKYITGIDGLDKVLEGIEEALKAGLKPVKLNYVVLRGVNDRELEKMLEYVKSVKNLALQVIELEPAGKGGEVFDKYYESVESIEAKIRELAESSCYRRDLHNRPQYRVDGVLVEFVRSHRNPMFCMNCTRIRVTSDGNLKTCLLRSQPLIPLNFKGGVQSIIQNFIEANKLRAPYYQKS